MLYIERLYLILKYSIWFTLKNLLRSFPNNSFRYFLWTNGLLCSWECFINIFLIRIHIFFDIYFVIRTLYIIARHFTNIIADISWIKIDVPASCEIGYRNWYRLGGITNWCFYSLLNLFYNWAGKPDGISAFYVDWQPPIFIFFVSYIYFPIFKSWLLNLNKYKLSEYFNYQKYELKNKTKICKYNITCNSNNYVHWL